MAAAYVNGGVPRGGGGGETAASLIASQTVQRGATSGGMVASSGSNRLSGTKSARRERGIDGAPSEREEEERGIVTMAPDQRLSVMTTQLMLNSTNIANNTAALGDVTSQLRAAQLENEALRQSIADHQTRLEMVERQLQYLYGKSTTAETLDADVQVQVNGLRRDVHQLLLRSSVDRPPPQRNVDPSSPAAAHSPNTPSSTTTPAAASTIATAASFLCPHSSQGTPSSDGAPQRAATGGGSMSSSFSAVADSATTTKNSAAASADDIVTLWRAEAETEQLEQSLLLPDGRRVATVSERDKKAYREKAMAVILKLDALVNLPTELKEKRKRTVVRLQTVQKSLAT